MGWNEHNRANVGRELEANLQAISRTPNVHREELLRHRHLPTLVTLKYEVVSAVRQFPLLSKLG